MKRLLAFLILAWALPCLAWNAGSYSATVDASRLTGNYDDYTWRAPGGQTLSCSLTVNDGYSAQVQNQCTTSTVIQLVNAVVGSNIVIVTNTTMTVTTNAVTVNTPIPMTGVTNATLTVWRPVPPYSATNSLGSNVLISAAVYGSYALSNASLAVSSNVFTWTVANMNLYDGSDLVELYATATNYSRVLSQGTLIVIRSGQSPVIIYTNSILTNTEWNHAHYR